MKTISRIIVALVLISAFLSSALPCGPGYVTPVFVTSSAPENPYSGYAAGQLGIVSPGYRRSLLYVAYRYVNGGSFTPDEQKALVTLWKSDIDRNYTATDDMSDTIKAWVDKRAEVVGKDEKVPDIYAERSYGGYDFFPNCTKNAFETATETLDDRASTHGPSDSGVQDWVKAQDDVFSNCSSGKRTPPDAPVGAPDWLQKDRAYQKAAASFYSLDYTDAKRRFSEIAEDSDSPWRETADYLVARTLIRQASLTKSAKSTKPLYEEAEARLRKFIGGSSKFAASAERMEGLISYRLRPQERVSELAKKLAFQSGDDNFKQDLVDYTWLLDKFETETLSAEAKRKARAEAAKAGFDDAAIETSVLKALDRLGVNVTVSVSNGEVTLSGDVDKDKVAAIMRAAVEAKPVKVQNNMNPVDRAPDADSDRLQITLYSEDYTKSWVINVSTDATDEDAIAEGEKVVGRPLTEDEKKRVREMRQNAYSERFTTGRQSDYEGGYIEGDESMTPALLPDFLKKDDLTNWLFVYQMKGPEAYAYSLARFVETNSDLWLMSALSKADKNSPELKRLLDSAERANRTAPGYLTIAFHTARLYLELGKNADARRIIEPMLSAGGEIPISVRNQFVGLRLRLAQTLDDYLTDSLRKAYAYDFSGSIGSIDELIAEQKSYYDPEYNKDGREAFDREIEDNFKQERLWQDRLMFDTATIGMMNTSFSQSVMLQTLQSPALPDYFRPRFAMAIWMRAYLLDDYATLLQVTPTVAQGYPEFADPLRLITEAKTPVARQNAILFFVLKNPMLSPFLEDGIGKTDNDFGEWDSNDWWCSSYMEDSETNDVQDTSQPPVVPPKFLTSAQKQAAATERKKIVALGDAPAFLASKVVAWAARSPADKRIPEALYIVHQANGWTKYGCGNNEELQKKIGDLMNKNYPDSPWTKKLTEEPEEK